jgi:hypothetical protein
VSRRAASGRPAGGCFDRENEAAFLRAQAEKCRWLAARVNAGEVAETLRSMARDYDARADRMERGGEAS